MWQSRRLQYQQSDISILLRHKLRISCDIVEALGYLCNPYSRAFLKLYVHGSLCFDGEQAYNGHTECLKVLLSHGAAVDSRSHGGVTPLIAAAEGRNAPCTQVLIQVSPCLTFVEPAAILRTSDIYRGFEPIACKMRKLRYYECSYLSKNMDL